jgi:hypothetical protein
MKIISFESSEERIGFLLLVVFMACVIGVTVWHAHAPRHALVCTAKS